jgi:hypothetical protein
MAEYYQIAVPRDVGNNLKFPSKCADCLQPTRSHNYKIVKHKELKGYYLRVPHCETHLKMIRYMKAVHYGTLSFALLLGVVIGRYLHNHRVFVVGRIGFNYIVAGVIAIAVWAATFFILHFLVLWQFAAKGSIDREGAVEIVGVYADAFVLQFHNKTYGIEFSQLNYATTLPLADDITGQNPSAPRF